MDLKRLADPFPASDVEWRVQRAGKKGDKVWAMVLAYITNRAIMERLDDVCGPENWRNVYTTGPDGGILCGIGIRVSYADGSTEWVTKYDGAANTEVEAVKGGLSGAMKRAGVQWGIGRYLYDLEEGFANIHDKGKHRGRLPEKAGGDSFNWDPPALPAWALPAVGGSRSQGVSMPTMLAFIQEIGSKCEEQVPLVRDGQPTDKSLKQWIRDNWNEIRANDSKARAAVLAVEESTGQTLGAHA